MSAPRGARLDSELGIVNSPFDLKDYTSTSFNIKQVVHANKNRRVRVATDILSPLLVLNSLESMYSYWTQLLSDIKQQDAVRFALVEEGMHPSVL